MGGDARWCECATATLAGHNTVMRGGRCTTSEFSSATCSHLHAQTRSVVRRVYSGKNGTGRRGVGGAKEKSKPDCTSDLSGLQPRLVGSPVLHCQI